ncbi:translation initiation factor IF-2, mitochondrial [Microplitis demolitor]|uniref:translation initiation factor IF-2, mitochondrial n=1 Tax=Microplitis demolitor TaxID=69319 RepID=UPI0004CD4B86|nr:translation initiation factor IF-2, mitochondrial [Microplitis demolitor]
MAASLVRACFKPHSLTRLFTEIFKNTECHGAGNKFMRAKVCIECHCYHTTPVFFKRRKSREEKKKAPEFTPKPKSIIKQPVVDVWKNMTVKELSESSGRSVNDVLEAISYFDTNRYNKNTVIEDKNIIFGSVAKLGAKYKIIASPHEKNEESKDHDVVKRPPPDPSICIKRHPVVTVMGHVDHGKTTLLDSLRHTSVVASEFGGITQHIGAFNVTLDTGEKITFLDTPGHAAFSAMRARGAQATDIVVLVVAADDGVMEQTIQSIKMARDANVPIIVAINKIDKPEADIKRTQNMLAQHGIQVEALGGEVPSVNISALKGMNLKELVETIVAQAEIMDLKGDPKGHVEGVVVEVSTEIGRGKLATALIQRGTLRKGSILVCGLAWAKVRAMFDHAANPVSEAKLSDAVQIIGWRELPLVGDEIIEVEDEKRAHVVIRYRKAKENATKAVEIMEVIKQKQTEHEKVYKVQLQERRALGRYRKKKQYGDRPKEIQEDDGIPRLHVLVKGDVLGSVEAILDVFDTYGDENRCHLDVIHYGIGPVTDSDIELADAFDAIIYTFNVNSPRKIEDVAKKFRVPIHSYKVIYKLIDDIKNEICKKLPPDHVEEKIGEANVLQHFEITERKKKINVAGCRCTDGILKKDSSCRIIRNGETIYEGKVAGIKHLKTDVNSIKSGVECGLRFENPDIIVQPGDTIICYVTHEVQPSVNWDPGF